MRTTLDLNDALLVRAKEFAARERTTLTRLIEQGLALVLDRTSSPPASPEPFRLRVFEGTGGLRPGIDPTSNVSIYEASELEYDRRKAGLVPDDQSPRVSAADAYRCRARDDRRSAANA